MCKNVFPSQFTNVTWNSSSESDGQMLNSVVNNPNRDTYALMYGMLLLAMLVILVVRSFIFAKVSFINMFVIFHPVLTEVDVTVQVILELCYMERE